MNNLALILKSHAYFAEEASGTCSATVKPAFDSGAFLSLGTVTKATQDPNSVSEKVPVYINVAGTQRLSHYVQKKKGLKFNFVTNQLNKKVFELAYGASITINENFTPLSGNTFKHGWLKCQRYGHGDELVTVFDGWVTLDLSSALEIADDLVMPGWDAELCYSTLNSGILPTASGL